MSKNKNIQNRLNDLFSDLEEQAEYSKSSLTKNILEDNVLPGWSWECDQQGNYISCSPEVEDILRISREHFLGNSIHTFQLSSKSIADLKLVFENMNFPQEVILQYKTSDDQLVAVRTHIFPIESIDETSRGWRGFNNVVSSDSIPVSTFDLSQPIKPEYIPTQSFRHFGFNPTGVAAEEGNQIFPANDPISTIVQNGYAHDRASFTPATSHSPAELVVPVDLHDRTLGVLEIIDPSPNRSWSQDEQRLVEQVANQLSMALENARLFQETQVSLSRTEALYNVGRAVIGFERPEEMLQEVVNTISEVLPSDRTIISILDLNSRNVIQEYSSVKLNSHTDELGFSVTVKETTNWCIRNEKPVLLIKGQADARETIDDYRIRQETDIGSVLIVPIVYRELLFGVLKAINGFEKPDFDENQLDLLSAMSNQIATALANARLFEEEKRRRQIADTLSQTARFVGATLNLEDVADRLLDQLLNVIQYSSAALYIIDNQRLTCIGSREYSESNSYQINSEGRKTVKDNPIIKEILKSNQTLLISDTVSDPHWQNNTKGLARSWIGAPLRSGKEIIGVLILNHVDPNIYDRDSENLISAISAQVSIAIRNAGLYQQVQRRSIQLQTAAEVSRAASSILEPNPLIQQAVNLIQDRFDLYYVGLFILDQTGEWTSEPGQWAVLRAGTGKAGRIQVERSHKLRVNNESMIGECIQTAEPITPKTIYEDNPRFINPLLPDTRTEIALPLVSRGLVIGAMSIQSEIEDAFSSEDIAILQTMADQVANALQNAYLFDQTQARAEELDILNEMSRVLSSILDTQSIIKTIYLYASRLIDTSTFFIALYDEGTNLLSFPYSIEDNKEVEIHTRPLGSGITEYIIRNRKPVLIQENLEAWLEEHNIEMQLHGRMPQSWLGAPLTIGDNTLGIICVQNQAKSHFNEHHRDLMNAIANQSSIVLQNARLFTQTEEALADTRALLNITSVASSSLELQETLSNVLDQVLEAINSQAGLISIADPFTQKLEIAAHKLPEKMLRNLQINGLDGTLCDWVFQERTQLVIDDLTHNSPTDASGAISLGFASYQGVPLVAKRQILGTLCTFSSRKLSERDNDLELLQAVGQQIGVAIDNANLFEQTQSQAEELAILNEMSRELSAIFKTDEIIATIYEYASKLMDTTYFFVALYDENEDEISFPFVIEQGEVYNIPKMKKRQGLTQYVIDTKEPLLITHNVKQRIAELGLEEIIIGNPAESWLGVPLIVGERVLGVIATQNSETPWIFSERDRDLMVSIARQSAIALQTASLFQTTQQQVRDLTTLSIASRTLASAPLDPQEVASIVAQQAGDIISKKTTATISLRDFSNSNQMRVVVSSNRHENELILNDFPNKQDYILSDYPAAAYVVLNGQPNIIQLSDTDADLKDIEYMQQHNISTLLMVPLMVKGEAIGIIELETLEEAYQYSDEEISLLVTLANQAAISIENARLYQEQLETAAQLRELDKLKSQFLANMSHELRTPLNSIIGFSRVIMKGIDGPVTELQQQDLSAIYNAGQHLLKMINDILDVSKVDAGKMEMSFEYVDVKEIINSVMSTARGLVKDKPIELVTAIEDDLPRIYADPTRIRQVLLNLLSNAAKFTDQGRITVTAQTKTNVTGQKELSLSVSDTGIGISPENQEQLFEPFVQVDGSPTRATGGTGLGLSITRMLVELHNGDIYLDSQVDKGSTFYVTLPLQERPIDEHDILSNPIILSIDSDPQVIKLYKNYLRDTQYHIIPIDEVKNALAYTKEIRPAVITLDVQLRDSDGWELLQSLKNDSQTQHIPVIICTILDEIDYGLSLGASDYLVKPILADDFIRAISKVVENKHLTS